jgi:hypothetical protein
MNEIYDEVHAGLCVFAGWIAGCIYPVPAGLALS